jgi:hypothetical protein
MCTYLQITSPQASGQIIRVLILIKRTLGDKTHKNIDREYIPWVPFKSDIFNVSAYAIACGVIWQTSKFNIAVSVHQMLWQSGCYLGRVVTPTNNFNLIVSV